MKIEEGIKIGGTIIGGVAGLGASLIIGTMCHPMVAAQTKTIYKLMMVLGAGALGGYVADKVDRYVCAQTNEFCELIKKYTETFSNETGKTVVEETEA